jgi:hypothetical protein
MFIAVNDIKKYIETLNLRTGLVAMPLEILAHPEHSPMVFGSHEGGLGRWQFGYLGRVLPMRTNLKDLNAVARNSVPQVKLAANRWRWTPTLHEGRECFLTAPYFDFG